MNKLDMFFKEEIDYEDFVQTVEEDASLDFLVEKDSPSTMSNDAVDDPGSDEDKFDIDALISDDEEKETDEENDTGYEDEQPVEESTIILF